MPANTGSVLETLHSEQPAACVSIALLLRSAYARS